ncbi:hypothetical protein JCM10213_008770 [Rhodosporidiobolus nylandii]
MVYPTVEPDSPVMYEEDEPELDGLRHLSVSTDGTIDSLISLDETPTPPHSPTPVVQVSPPGSAFSFTGPRGLIFNGEDYTMADWSGKKKELASGSQTPLAPATPMATGNTPFFSAATAFAPQDCQPEPPRGVNLAARRVTSGKLPTKALLSLQQMRFESSSEAGMGLGVGPPSSGLEGISPGGPGFTFRAAMGLDGEDKNGRGSRLPSPGVENIALDSPLGPPAQIRWPAQIGSKTARTPAASPSGSPKAFKPSRRNNLRLNLSGAAYSPSSSPLPSPTGERRPASPHIMRSSAFISNTGPRTPLTPSHLPAAPALGAGGAAFEWFSYSFPDSPGCPAPPPGVPVAERSCYFSDLAVSSPSSSDGTYLPTPGSERGRTPLGAIRRSASPLRQGRFA